MSREIDKNRLAVIELSDTEIALIDPSDDDPKPIAGVFFADKYSSLSEIQRQRLVLSMFVPELVEKGMRYIDLSNRCSDTASDLLTEIAFDFISVLVGESTND